MDQDTRTATAGAVTFLPDAPQHRDKTVIRLLTAITVLLGLLVVGLAAGALWLALEYQRAQAAFATQMQAWRDETTHAIALSQDLVRDTLVRQDALGASLAARSARTKAQLAELDRRRASLGPIPPDPFNKADYMIRLNYIALDETRTINHHWVDAQILIGQHMDLTASQRQLLKDLEAARQKR